MALFPRLPRPVLALAAVLLTVPAVAQEQGVSHPELLNDSIAASPAQSTAQTPPQSDHYQPRRPLPLTESYAPATTANNAGAPVAPAPMTAESLPGAVPGSALAPYSSSYAGTSSTPMPPQAHSAEPLNRNDPSDGMVTEVPDTPGTLLDGTLIHARLMENLSTKTTPSGTRFSAQVAQNVGHHGEVMIPVGSLLLGRVTDVHGGRRIGGPAMLRLTPEILRLPDGRELRVSAEVAGLDDFTDSRVNGEGVIVARSNSGQTAAAIGLSTAGGAAVGAVVGGPVGLAVGAVAGAGVSTAVWLKQEHQEMLPVGTQVVFCLRRTLHLDESGPQPLR